MKYYTLDDFILDVDMKEYADAVNKDIKSFVSDFDDLFAHNIIEEYLEARKNNPDEVDDSDLYDYVDDVDGAEMLKNAEYAVDVINAFDVYKVRVYMKDRNEAYCDTHGLCSYCRHELVDVTESRGEFWGAPAYETYTMCPYCD